MQDPGDLVPPIDMTRRDWLGAAASAAALAVFGTTSTRAFPHPAIPARVLDRQLDAAVRSTIARAPAAAREALIARATRWFGAARGPAVVAVPGEVRDAVERLLTRG